MDNPFLGLDPLAFVATADDGGLDVYAAEARRSESGVEAIMHAQNGHSSAHRPVCLADGADLARFACEALPKGTDAARTRLVSAMRDNILQIHQALSVAEKAQQRRKPGRPPKEKAPQEQARGLWIKASAVDVRPPVWIWERYILRGHLNLLAGDGDVGKSFTTMKMAAHITTGSPWPDGSPCPKGAVLVVPGEDDESTYAWRFGLMGGDPEHLHILQGMDIRDADTDDPLVVRLSLTKAIHVAEVERKIRETGAVFTILDPAESFLEAGTRTSDGVAVRQITNPLEDMAQRTDSTTLVVVHLNKAALSDAIHRVSGAQTWFNAPRAALVAGHDPDSDNGRRLLLPFKMNLAEKPTGFGYRITGAEGVVWDGPAAMVARDMLKPRLNSTEGGSGSKSDLAQKMLRGLLRYGEQRAGVIYAVTRAAGLSDRTVDSAKATLHITSRRVGHGEHRQNFWGPPAEGFPGTEEMGPESGSEADGN